MKILHINTYDVGGAATACRRIHLGLLEKGIDSKILLLHKTKTIPQTYKFLPILVKPAPILKVSFFQKIFNKLSGLFFSSTTKSNNLIQKRVIKNFKAIDNSAEDFSFPYSSYDITQSPLYEEADIIQINWASGFLNEETFFAKNSKPVVWRMPDLYPTGGGYHYEKGFPFESFKDIINENIEIKKKAYFGKNIYFVPISNWVKDKANKSDLTKQFPKKIIHNGVDFRIFKPHNKNFARQVFNLPTDKTILLFGSDLVSCKRKGIDILMEALKMLRLDEIQLVTFGQNPHVENIEYVSVGEIKDELLLSILYSAADFFIMPSIEEAFGQVTIEALACGTPVVSFPNGGSSDIIINELNGLLAKDFTSVALRDAIDNAIKIKFDKEKILQDVHSRFNIVDKVNEYINLYEEILRNNKPNENNHLNTIK